MRPRSSSIGGRRLGYWLVGGDGGVFTFGDAHFYGSHAGSNVIIVGMIATANQGYRLISSSGFAYRFGSA